MLVGNQVLLINQKSAASLKQMTISRVIHINQVYCQHTVSHCIDVVHFICRSRY